MTTPRPETSTSFAEALRESLKRLSADQVLPYLIALTPDETTELNFYWDVFGHHHQRPPPGDWTTRLLLGGRGAGKTRAGAEWVKQFALSGTKQGPIALIGETEHDAREVMVEGVSGLLSVHDSAERPTWIPSRRRIEWNNGAVAQVFSAEDPESLRGPQFAAAWCDELAKWRYAETGYTNHPSDPGGPTNFGITIADYRQYVKPGGTAADVRAMHVDQAKAIYRDRYWNAMRCDELPVGLDYAVFDFGVNSGNGRAVKFLKRLVGLEPSGRMTDATVAAAAGRDAGDLAARLCDARLAFLKQLKTWPVFGAGWGRRVAEVRAVALTMVRATPLPEKPPASPANASRPANALGAVLAALWSAVRQWFQALQKQSITGAKR